MKKNILIIGSETDPHITEVIKKIDTANYTAIVLDPSGSNSSITFTYDPFQLVFTSYETRLNAADVDSVWWRLKPLVMQTLEGAGQAERQGFINREWHLTLDTLSYFLQDCFWMNKRAAEIALKNKPFQLFHAGQYGFSIPCTIISNDFIAVSQKTASFKDILYKPLSYFIAPPDKILYANKVSPKKISDSPAEIKIAPCIFQDYVDKEYELRITIVDSKIFPVKILSQQSALTEIDWRRNQLKAVYELAELDPLFESQLLSFHNKMGIVFGAYDFIVDKQGNHIFLEVNPVGQWLWLEKLVGMDISQEVARVLSAQADSSCR